MNNIIEEPLLLSKQCLVINSEVEGSCKVKSIQGIRLVWSRQILGALLAIFTCFLFVIACSWSKKLTRIFFFEACDVNSASHFWVINEDDTPSICKKQIANNNTFILNRKLKYFYQQDIGAFKPLEFTFTQWTKQDIIQNGLKGVSDPNYVREQYGKCAIEIPIPSIFTYLLKELTAPFYILQYFTCVLWILENYAQLAVIMFTFSITFTTLNYFLLLSSVKKLRELAQNKQQVKVFRPLTPQQNYQVIDSEEIVPGDVLAIETKSIIPCDCIILSGELTMNEATLTGESIPVHKNQLDQNDQYFSQYADKRHCLYQGTKVLLSRSTHHNYVLAQVIRTGFSSFKGQIFRSVLYPKPQKFLFYTQAIKFLSGLAILILIIYFVELYRLIEVGFKPTLIVYRFADAITWIIPPALPIFVSMCQTFSLLRLRKQHDIFGVDPIKALVAGQINTVCFDKTGTLTTTEIEVYGYQICENYHIKSLLQPMTSQVQENDYNSLHFKLFATCHGIALIDGEIMGDSLDVRMFEFSGYQIQEVRDPNIKMSVRFQNTQLDILRMFEFESEFQRMSVIVRENNEYFVYCKGSPEKISELSQESSIPINFKQQLDVLTMKGLRVLGISYRKLSEEEFKQILQGDRNDVERNLVFLGLLIMENKLKHDTADEIQALKYSGLDLKIISGDNGLTTIQCARECQLIDPDQPILLIDYNEKKKQLELEEVDQAPQLEEMFIQNQDTLDCYVEDTQDFTKQPDHSEVMQTLIKYLIRSDRTIKRPHLNLKLSQTHESFQQMVDRFGFAITGKAFDFFWAQSPQSHYLAERMSFAGFENPLQDLGRIDVDDSKTYSVVFSALITQAKVFSRMRPEQKSQIIETLQKLGRCVAMIGDGANDCAAIKQANVGISFAQSDASYSAPFSSQSQSISCVRKVLLDGRGSLTNTIIVFQYYIFASVLKYIGAMLLASYGQNYSTLQMIYVNYISTLPFLTAISLTGPGMSLVNRLPEDDMFKLPNQIAIYLHIIICGLGMAVNYIYWVHQNFEDKISVIPDHQDGQYIQEGSLQTTLFLSACLYFVTSFISIYISKPFKKSLYQEPVLMVFILIVITLCIYFYSTFNHWMYSVLSILDLGNHNYLFTQLGFSLSFSFVMIVCQELIRLKYPCTKPLFERKE